MALTDGEGLVSVAFALDRRQPVSEQVYEVLRQAIIGVQLPPGTPISENSLCRQFTVSRTPVRAAILRLSKEGLVDVYPQQGSFVSAIKLSDIRDSHFVRRSLERALLREVAGRWTPAMSREMRDVIAAQADDIARGDVDAFHRDDERFHRLLAVYAERAGVWGTILEAKTRLTRFIRFSGKAKRLRVVLTEHEAIVDALDRGDADAADDALTLHLDRIFVLFEQLPERDRAYFTN